MTTYTLYFNNEFDGEFVAATLDHDAFCNQWEATLELGYGMKPAYDDWKHALDFFGFMFAVNAAGEKQLIMFNHDKREIHFMKIREGFKEIMKHAGTAL